MDLLLNYLNYFVGVLNNDLNKIYNKCLQINI